MTEEALDNLEQQLRQHVVRCDRNTAHAQNDDERIRYIAQADAYESALSMLRSARRRAKMNS